MLEEVRAKICQRKYLGEKRFIEHLLHSNHCKCLQNLSEQWTKISAQGVLTLCRGEGSQVVNNKKASLILYWLKVVSRKNKQSRVRKISWICSSLKEEFH